MASKRTEIALVATEAGVVDVVTRWWSRPLFRWGSRDGGLRTEGSKAKEAGLAVIDPERVVVRAGDFRVVAERGYIRTDFQFYVPSGDWYATGLPASRARNFLFLCYLHRC